MRWLKKRKKLKLLQQKDNQKKEIKLLDVEETSKIKGGKVRKKERVRYWVGCGGDIPH